MGEASPKTHPPVDVLICGGGSAGICAAAWLSRLGLPCKILERRPGPLEIGQADGVQCRTVEVFDSFGLAEELLREAYHVLEVAFWTSDPSGDGIKRTRRNADTEVGLSHQPHVILNQARINGILIAAMNKWSGQEVDFGYVVKTVSVDSEAAKDPQAYAVTVVAEKDGQDEVFKAKYVLGCDGAHSQVRKSLGFKMIGDTTDSVWGVMDVFPLTNFPDIRRKVVLQTNRGSLMIIPREGGSLVRLYMELPAGTVAKEVSLSGLHETARRIFAPYQMEFADTFWWSAYSIGQRVADFFSENNRVFLTGDACHTHSPKAGQGMNTSLQDGYNIGWKLGSILRGQAPPSILETYTFERSKVAHDLISFDRELTSLLSSKAAKEDPNFATKFSDYFIKTARYTAGLTATYGDTCFTNAAKSTQSLATNIIVGMRLPSAQVVRHCDAKAIQLAKAFPADGRWRIAIFAGDISKAEDSSRLTKARTPKLNIYLFAFYLLSDMSQLAAYFDSKIGPVRTCTPADADIDSLIEPIVVLTGSRVGIELEQIPDYFWPVTGKWGIRGKFSPINVSKLVWKGIKTDWDFQICTRSTLMIKAIILAMARLMSSWVSIRRRVVWLLYVLITVRGILVNS